MVLEPISWFLANVFDFEDSDETKVTINKISKQ